jgi:hypothetical protein
LWEKENTPINFEIVEPNVKANVILITLGENQFVNPSSILIGSHIERSSGLRPPYVNWKFDEPSGLRAT